MINSHQSSSTCYISDHSLDSINFLNDDKQDKKKKSITRSIDTEHEHTKKIKKKRVPLHEDFESEYFELENGHSSSYVSEFVEDQDENDEPDITTDGLKFRMRGSMNSNSSSRIPQDSGEQVSNVEDWVYGQHDVGNRNPEVQQKETQADGLATEQSMNDSTPLMNNNHLLAEPSIRKKTRIPRIQASAVGQNQTNADFTTDAIDASETRRKRDFNVARSSAAVQKDSIELDTLKNHAKKKKRVPAVTAAESETVEKIKLSNVHPTSRRRRRRSPSILEQYNKGTDETSSLATSYDLSMHTNYKRMRGGISNRDANNIPSSENTDDTVILSTKPRRKRIQPATLINTIFGARRNRNRSSTISPTQNSGRDGQSKAIVGSSNEQKQKTSTEMEEAYSSVKRKRAPITQAKSNTRGWASR